MKEFKGLPGAQGQALREAVRFGRKQVAVAERRSEDPEAEVQRFQAVRQEYIAHLRQLHDETMTSLGEDAAKIFKAYEIIVMDDFFFKKPLNKAREERLGVDWAVELEKRRTVQKFAKMDDPYMQERATDIANVCDELIRRFHGVTGDDGLPENPQAPFLVVASDLTPEDTVRIDKAHLAGFVTEKGGVTSHAVILAKTLGIPAVVGVPGILDQVQSGQLLYVNGGDGTVVLEPDDVFVQRFQVTFARQEERKKRYAEIARRPAVTLDGHQVAVCVNSGDEDSMAVFDADACDGIGLLRTEFLFMGQRDYPDEELQYTTYRTIAHQSKGKEVILRTLDIGGDKQLDYMEIPKEDNPFLGFRAIRICLERGDMFLTQLRAALRASAHGNIKIMLPMIVTLEELLEAKALVEKAKAQLREKGQAFAEDVPVGIMVETPGAVLLSDVLARHCDFFSIGTNDLIQYVTATDRMNNKVQYLYDPCNLSVLRAVRTVIRAGHDAGIPVGMCGEMASYALLVPLLLGMGLDEFSVVPTQVGQVKDLIGGLRYDQLADRVDELLALETIGALKERLEKVEV